MIEHELHDMWLFVFTIGKVLLYTGLGLGIVVILARELFSARGGGIHGRTK